MKHDSAASCSSAQAEAQPGGRYSVVTEFMLRLLVRRAVNMRSAICCPVAHDIRIWCRHIVARVLTQAADVQGLDYVADNQVGNMMIRCGDGDCSIRCCYCNVEGAQC